MGFQPLIFNGFIVGQTGGGGGGGTVTNVAFADSTGLFNITGSPVTSSGTLTLSSFQSKSANTFFAGPNGSSGAPTFRLLVNADLPSTINISGTITASNFSGSSSGTNTGDVTIGTANGLSLAGQALSLQLSDTTHTGSLSSTDWNTFNNKQPAGSYITALTGEVTASGPGSSSATLLNSAVIGKVLTGFVSGPNSPILATDSILQAFQKAQAQLSASGGTVTSVALADSTGLFNITGSPVTSSGTLTLSSFQSQAQHSFFAAPSGSSGAPTFRAIVASDVPTLNQNTTGTASNITASSNSTITTLTALSLPTSQLSGNISLTTQVSGILPSANGGTGVNNSSNLTIGGTSSINGTFSGTSSGTNTGDQTITLTGDITGSGTGSFATTLATVNGNVGSFGSSTSIPSFTVNAKGLITAASGNVVIAPAGTLSGTTLNATVVTSSLTSLGAQAAALNMNSHKINNVTDPTSAQDAATKAYVDNVAAGINPAVAVQAATTAASDTSGFTYNNGVSGIGATLTSNATNTALTIDGFTFTTLNQRLLVKNDTQSPSGAFNGIYYVTQVQALALPLILTRALDYDQPSDINNTGAIPVINGTVNGTTQWVETALVNTVGTDPLTFVKFARNPADYLLKANNLSDVASASTSFNNISPMTTLGDIIYENATPSGTRLAGNITSTKQFLSQTGTGAISAAPAWTALVSGDIPNNAANTTGTASNVTGIVVVANGGTGLATLTANNVILGNGTSSPLFVAPGTSGNVLTSNGTTWTSSASSSGTVTSVALTVPAFLSVSGSPITTSGTLAVSFSGTALPIANGGTAATTAAAAFNNLNPMTTTGDLIYESATNVASRLPIGTAGQVLSVSSGIPAWTSLSANGFDFFASSQVTNGSSDVTGTTYATFSNSPAFTFTPNFTGKYKVYASVPLLQGTGSVQGFSRVFNTSGSGTLLYEASGTIFPNIASSTYVQSVYTLTSGNSYVFDIQGKNSSSGTLSLDANSMSFYMFAELCG